MPELLCPALVIPRRHPNSRLQERSFPMTSRKNARARIGDSRQLMLFPELQSEDDPLFVYYWRLRKIGATLTYDLERRQFFVYGVGGLPGWVVTATTPFRQRIIADLLRVEHDIEPFIASEELHGGAVLHRLPLRRSPEAEPPVRSPASPGHHRGDGVA